MARATRSRAAAPVEVPQKPQRVQDEVEDEDSELSEAEDMENPEEQDEVEDEHDGALRALQFAETLTWRAGKPIPLATLLSRLQILSDELREMEQEDIDKSTLGGVAKELVQTGLVNHKDRGVRSWTAACLVDILRVSAPDAPYNAKELKVSRFITIAITRLTSCRKSSRSSLSLFFPPSPIPPTHTIPRISILSDPWPRSSR